MSKQITFLLLFLFCAGMFTSCSYKTRRENAKSKIQRLSQQYNLSTLEADTLFVPEIVTDTVIIDSTKTEEVFKFKTDTVYTVKNERAEARVVVSRDSIFIDIMSPPDTIILMDTVYKEVISSKEVINTEKDCWHCAKQASWKILLLLLIIGLVIFGLNKLNLRIFNK